MTTVGVTIRRVEGPEVLYLSNGLFGPATTALHALIDAYLTGTIQGNWHSTYISTTISGAVVRSVLAAVDEHDREFREESDRAQFITFRDTVDDGAGYTIKAIEMWHRVPALTPARTEGATGKWQRPTQVPTSNAAPAKGSHNLSVFRVPPRGTASG